MQIYGNFFTVDDLCKEFQGNRIKKYALRWIKVNLISINIGDKYSHLFVI